MKLSQKIILTFNSEIGIDDKIIDKLSLKIDDKDIKVEKIQVNNMNKLEIQIQITDSLENSELKINPITTNTSKPLIHKKNNGSIFNNYPIKLPISIYLDPNSGIGTSGAQAASITILALTIPLILSNPIAIITLIRLLQSFGYLSFINIDLPKIVQEIMIQFEINPGRLFPFLISQFFIDDRPYNCNIHPKLRENDVSCIGVTPLLINLLILVLGGIIKIIVFIPVFWARETTLFGYMIIDIIKVERLGNSKNSKNEGCLLYRLVKIVNSKMSLNFYFLLLKSMEIDIFLNSWATLKSLRVINFWSIISNIILLFFVINNIVYSILVFIIFSKFNSMKKNNKIGDKGSQKIENKSEDIEKINGVYQSGIVSMMNFCKDSLREDTKYGVFIYFAYSLRDMILPLILIFFIEIPAVQLLTALIFNIGILSVLFFTRPMPSFYDNSLEIFNSFTFLILLLIYSAIYAIGYKFTEKQKSIYFGYSIIALLFGMTAINIIFSTIQGIITIYFSLKYFLSKRKQKDGNIRSNKVKSESKKSEKLNNDLNSSQLSLNYEIKSSIVDKNKEKNTSLQTKMKDM